MIILQIYVDADACPVKKEIEQVATRHKINVILVSNGGIRPSINPIIKIVVVEQGPVSYTHLTLPTILLV